MAWRAFFIDGPLEGKEHDRMFMGAWQDTLRFAPAPFALADDNDGWILVGLGFDDDWPGQVTYVRDEARSQLLPLGEPGADEGFAGFRLEAP